MLCKTGENEFEAFSDRERLLLILAFKIVKPKQA